MALPTGVTTCVVSAGAPLDFAGTGGTISLTVAPVLGGNANHITWSATGQPLVNFASSASADAGQQATVVMPHVDQPGFIDGSGNAATNWSYRATITFTGANRQKIAWTKTFQLLQGQTSVDLDLVPDGSITSPTSAPIPAVTSVGGQTGAVTLDSLGLLSTTDVGTPGGVAGLDATTGDVLDASGQPVTGATDAGVAAAVGEPLTSAALGATYAGRFVSSLPGSILPTATYTGNSAAHEVAWMSADGQRIYDYNQPTLSYSTDGGATWTTLHTFTQPVYGVREMPNGEVIVGLLNYSANHLPGEIWISTGFQANPTGASWTKTLTLTGELSAAANWYSFSPPLHHMDSLPAGVNMGTIVVGEYGGAAGYVDAPRKVYASEDYGKTWLTIFDTTIDPAITDVHHIHGVAYDPWEDAVWFSQGDDSQRRLAYSTNWRNGLSATWTDIQIGEWQQVAIWPLPHCLLIGTDRRINGMFRIDRTPGSGYDETLKVAYQVNGIQNLRNLPRLLFRRPDTPLLIPYTANAVGDENGNRYGLLLATRDGYAFEEMWREPTYYTDTTFNKQYGLYTALGPTAQGTLVGHLRDDSRSTPLVGGDTLLSAPWPTVDKMPASADAKAYAKAQVDVVARRVDAVTVEVMSSGATSSFDGAGAWSAIGSGTIPLPAGWLSATVVLTGWVGMRVVATTTTMRRVQYDVQINGVSIKTQWPYKQFAATSDTVFDTAPVFGAFGITANTTVGLVGRVTSTDKTNTGSVGYLVQAHLTRTA